MPPNGNVKLKCPHDQREEVWSRGGEGVEKRFLGERCIKCNTQFTSDKCTDCGAIVRQKADPKRKTFTCAPCVRKREADEKGTVKDEHDVATVEAEAGGDR